MPLVSVVIPAFNRELTIGVTLDSLLEQTLLDWEALVVDDGSTDGTAQIAAEYAGRDARFRVLRQANAGVSAARNAAIAVAEGRWMFFLDADDWIAPEALELLTDSVAGDPSATLGLGRSVSVFPSGEEVVEDPAPPAAEMFAAFARKCAFSIHTCLVPTALVRAVGGFDESLVTCEDWDLWLRIARTLPSYRQLPQSIAYYRIRPGESASRHARQMLRDGLTVIERGHGDDPRLAGWDGPLHPGESTGQVINAQLLLVGYAAGLAVGAGQDPRDLLDLIPAAAPGEVDAEEFAQILFYGTALGKGSGAEGWPSFPPETIDELQTFVAAVGEQLGDNWLAFTANDVFERLLVGYGVASDGASGPRVGRTQLCEIRVGDRIVDIPLEDGVERVMIDVHRNGVRVGFTAVPAADGVLPAYVAADAILDLHTWDLLADLLDDTVYPGLGLTRIDGDLQVSRDGIPVGRVRDNAARPERELVHAAAGWTVFLQELWGLPGCADFYSPQHTDGSATLTETREVAGTVVSVEVAEPLPTIVTADDHVVVEVRLAGAPLMALRIPGRDGRVTPSRLRRAICLVGRFELARAAMREGVLLGAPWPAGTPLRERLARTAARRRGAAVVDEIVPAGRHAVVLGRRRSDDFVGPACRAVAFPYATSATLVGAAGDGQQVLAVGPTDAPGIGLYLPCVFDPRTAAIDIDPDADYRAARFDALYTGTEDPWNRGSGYERRKDADTLALVPAGIGSALELGCGEGTLTEALAERVDRLTAVDISQVAIDRARARCPARDDVSFRRLDAFSDELPGPVDLILCADLLQLLDRRTDLRRQLDRFRAALSPGGKLLLSHDRAVVDDPDRPGFDWAVPFGGRGIARAVAADRRFVLEAERTTDLYVVQRYGRAGRLPRLRRAAVVREHAADVPQPGPEAAAHLVAGGGRIDDSPSGALLRSLPILMYHRIAPSSEAVNARWTTTPGAFEAQLQWLRENRYESVSLHEWALAGSRDLGLPGRRVILTFDDGYQDFADHAVPLLVKYGFRAELFAVPGRVGGENDWEPPGFPRYPLMDWPTLRALPHRTVSIGAHTVNHPLLPTLSAVAVMDELVRSRVMLEDGLGRQVTSLAYPYGAAGDAVTALAGPAGFDHAYTTEHWHAHIGWDLLKLPRLEIRGGTSLADFGRTLRRIEA